MPRTKRTKLSGQTIGGLTLAGISIHEGVHCECADAECDCAGK